MKLLKLNNLTDLYAGKHLDLNDDNVTDKTINELFNVNNKMLYAEIKCENLKDVENVKKLLCIKRLRLNVRLEDTVDINSLKFLYNLICLVLQCNKISNIDCLENLINLKYLHLTDNKIVNISSLTNLLI